MMSVRQEPDRASTQLARLQLLGDISPSAILWEKQVLTAAGTCQAYRHSNLRQGARFESCYQRVPSPVQCQVNHAGVGMQG